MLSQQFIARAGQRIARQPAVRSAFRRNYASQGTAQGAGEHGFQGAADNAFNRERAAVKQHAAETSGSYTLSAYLGALVVVWGS